MPAFATDCHHHVYDDRFPSALHATLSHADAGVDDYVSLANWLGIERHVVVQPSLYGQDNRALLHALDRFGGTARGIVVTSATTPERELERLNMRGVRGVRINARAAGGLDVNQMIPLATRIAHLGWHIEIAINPDEIFDLTDTFAKLPCPIVFDHMAYLRGDEGLRHPAFGCIAKLLESGKAWVKLSGAYIGSRDTTGVYADAVPVAQAFVRLAADRMLWGSDWPHPTIRDPKPDDSLLLDLLEIFCPTRETQINILVNNPASLYGF